MRYAYREACSEVCFILGNLEESCVGMIPDKMINLLEKNKIKHYPINIDLSIPLNEQVLKEETKAILALLYRKFLCSPSERLILEEEFQIKLKKEKATRIVAKEELSNLNKEVEDYVPENKVVNSSIVSTDINIKNAVNELRVIEEKESFFSRVLLKIKRFLHIK